jgi:hypothetical protein
MSGAQVPFDEVTETYLRYLTDHDERDFWAFEKTNKILKNLDDRFRIVSALIDKAPSDEVLAIVAAGPLEDFFDLHSLSAFRLIADAAPGNPRVQRACAMVAMSFWHELFELWYSLKCEYGFAEMPVSNPEEVIASVMQCMRTFVNGQGRDSEYQTRLSDLLSKPIEPLDEERKSILKQADWDSEMFDGSELRERTALLLQKLEVGG